ncbi:MAG: hypothetical protein DMG01_03575 [Acidobacteria bacterium]|nr:MAG: hypothetical protein DMG01_03575 [Acidobacteriota bacterium]
MCGICGELAFDGAAPVDPDVLVAMRDRLVHRGPDDRGLFVSRGGRAGLGFRRLRIIDPQRCGQSADGQSSERVYWRYWLFGKSLSVTSRENSLK